MNENPVPNRLINWPIMASVIVSFSPTTHHYQIIRKRHLFGITELLLHYLRIYMQHFYIKVCEKPPISLRWVYPGPNENLTILWSLFEHPVRAGQKAK